MKTKKNYSEPQVKLIDTFMEDGFLVDYDVNSSTGDAFTKEREEIEEVEPSNDIQKSLW